MVSHSFNRILVLALILLMMVGFLAPAAARAAASLRLSRSVAAASDKVDITGNGFHPGDSVVVAASFDVGGTPKQVSATSQVDPGGAFRTTLAIPGGTSSGMYSINAKDFHGDQTSQKLIVLPLAYFKVGGSAPTIYVVPSHAFYVSGTGFKANETVKLTGSFPQYDGNTVVIDRSLQADGHGNIAEILLRVPGDARPGKVTMQAAGQSSAKKAEVTADVVYHPALTLKTYDVRPGATLTITGHGFVPNSTVHVSVTFPRNGTTSITESRDAGSGGDGGFTTSIGLPGNTSVGKYTVSAVGSVDSFRATTSVSVSVHPTIAVNPTSVYAGGNSTVLGGGFGANAHVTIQATFALVGGGSRTVYVPAGTGTSGNFSARLYVPDRATAGATTVYAKTSNGQATAHLQVLRRQKPTATATATPKATPTAAATPVPAPTKHHRRPQFDYRYVSVWYHVVRLGTWEHIQFQSALHTQLGVWVHVYFPSSAHADYYQHTNGNGFWAKTFWVPRNALGAHSNQVVVTFRLWHGKKSVYRVAKFTLVR